MNTEAINLAREFILNRYPKIGITDQNYFILFTPRSGSNMLCGILEKAGIGKPIEAFSPHANYRKRMNWNIDYSDPYQFMAKVIEYQTVNGILGMKLSISLFQEFLKVARQLLGEDFKGLNDFETTEVFFPNARYIHIQRKDKVKQAVSLAKALQNGIWIEKEDEDQEYKKYLLPALYDREHIECCFDLSLSGDVFWSQFLTKYNIPHLSLFYEDIVSNYEERIKEIFNFIGIKQEQVPSPKSQRQANKQSNNWVIRFTEETDWLKNEEIQKAINEGDIEGLYYLRSRMLIKAREQARWHVMPATRYKSIRSLAFRIKRKLLSYFPKKTSNID